MKDVVFWLAGQFAGRLAVAYQSLTGMQAHIDAREAPSAHPRPDDLIWREPVSGIGATIWVCVPKVVWSQVGRQVLEAAGLTDITDEDARSSFHELLQQSTSPLGQLISACLQREINIGPGAEEQTAPDPMDWIAVPLSPPGVNWPPLLFAPDQTLVASLAPPEVRKGNQEDSVAQSGGGSSALVPGREGRNLELLMEVELPLGVSFGRTRMRLKDAVKLTTGSIVELNRAISEPVEVIVNNCVIARGEVVVIEGNYGIRIRQIVSREERLRTLF